MEKNRLEMRLQCPMPNLDFDRITLGHGSGGLLTNKLLDSMVFELFDNSLLQTRHDGALLQLEGRVAFSTDSYVVSPIFFPGGSIGDLAINGTINDLAMCGAKPQYLSLSLIIEEGFSISELWDVLLSIKFACEKAGVVIVTGDTKVVEKGKGDKIFINTSGIGSVHPKANLSADRIIAGDKIIVSGNLANHGMAIYSIREGLEFESNILSDTRELSRQVLSLIDAFGDNIKLCRDPSRGGVATSLNEIARSTHLGINLWQDKLPMESQVLEACEMLGLDPLYVANEGIFLTIVADQKAEEMLTQLKSLPHCETAEIIGEFVQDHPTQVLLNSAIGGRRVINMLIGEQLPRIC